MYTVIAKLPFVGAAGALKAAFETVPSSAVVIAQQADGKGSC